MSKYSRVSLLFVSAILIICGIFLVIPTNNLFIHNPLFSTLMSECSVPGTLATARLIMRDGGSTTGYGYEVTYQENFFSGEYDVFYSYEEPEIMAIDCEEKTLRLTTRWTSIEIPYAQIRDEMTRNPLKYKHGNKYEYTTLDAQLLDLLCTMSCPSCGALLLVLGITALVRKRNLFLSHQTASRD
jgi:hypothetical protein